MASSVQRRSYEEHVTCPVCMDLLSDPRTLPCMHTYCMECLNSYITSVSKPGEDRGFKCAVCKAATKPPFKGMHPYSWAENFPVNFALKGVVDEMKNKQMRSDPTTRLIQSDRTMCKSHEDRVVEFECLDHDTQFCSVCAALFHRKCEHVNFLKDEAGDISTVPLVSSESEMKHRVVTRTSQTGLECLETSTVHPFDPDELANDFANARSIVDVTPTSMDTSSHPEDNTYNSDEETKRSSGRKPLKRVCAINTADTKLSEGNKHSQLRGSHFSSDSTLARHPLVESPYANLNNSEPDQQLASNTLNDIQEEEEDIVSVSIDQKVSKSQITLTSEVYVRSQNDDKCCSVTGLCSLSDGRILLTDEANVNVKLFEANGMYRAFIQLNSPPWDVTAIEQYEAAVSCPSDRSIHILLVYDTLSVARTIVLDKKVYGLMYHEGEIFVAMDNEVRILSYDGRTLHKISSTTSRKKLFPLSLPIPKSLFRLARHISVSPHDKGIVFIVSDAGKRCVTSLMRNGKIVSRLRLGEDGVPNDVSVGEKGELYVCQAPNRLIAISSDEHGNRIKHLLDLDLIQSVHFHKTLKQLWVARKAHNFVMVYTVKKENT